MKLTVKLEAFEKLLKEENFGYVFRNAFFSLTKEGLLVSQCTTKCIQY